MRTHIRTYTNTHTRNEPSHRAIIIILIIINNIIIIIVLIINILISIIIIIIIILHIIIIIIIVIIIIIIIDIIITILTIIFIIIIMFIIVLIVIIIIYAALLDCSPQTALPRLLSQLYPESSAYLRHHRYPRREGLATWVISGHFGSYSRQVARLMHICEGLVGLENPLTLHSLLTHRDVRSTFENAHFPDGS